ncbi:MAG TPA: hypothetical protein VK589_21685 [Chryseolinea sp.]|nr:hypothetical protein [Chryseolinea sp.]
MYYKITITIALLLLTISRSVAQDDPNKALQQQKLLKYKNMKSGGVALIVLGGILVVAGGIIEVSQFEESMSTMWSSEPEKEYNNTGTVLFCSGLVVAGAGIPLTIIGHRKYKFYKQNADVISLGIKAHPQSTGISLTYRF